MDEIKRVAREPGMYGELVKRLLRGVIVQDDGRGNVITQTTALEREAADAITALEARIAELEAAERAEAKSGNPLGVRLGVR